MMGKRKRRHGGGSRGLVGQVKKFGRMAGNIIGITVVLSPAIKGVVDSKSDPTNIPHSIVYNYTGLDTETGGVNFQQTATGVSTVVAGVVIMKLISYALR